MKMIARRCLQLALLLLSLNAGASEEAWNAAIQQGTAQFRSGDYAAALESFRRSIRASDDFAADDPRRATSHNNTGLILKRLGRYQEAAGHYQQALELRERIVGPEHPIVASTLTNIGALKKVLGDYAEAERLYRRALAIMESNHGPNHPELCPSLGNLAVLLQDQGRLKEAEQLQRRAYEIRLAALGADHLDTALSEGNLANIYLAMGQYARAESMLQHVLAVDQRQLGNSHPHVASDMSNLALTYQHQGQLAKAEQLFRRALGIARGRFGDGHPETVAYKSNLAALYLAQQRLADAERLMREVLDFERGHFGERHIQVARAHNNLAALYQRQGLHEQALKHYMQALEINVEKLGNRHPRVAATSSNIAGVLASAYQPMAEKFFLQAIAIWRENYGDRYPELAKDYTSLAVFYDQQRRYDDALQAVRKSTRIHRARAANSADDRGAISERASRRDSYALHAYLLHRQWQQSHAPALVAEGFEVAQLAAGVGAAQAVSQMAARFGSGNDELAALVRRRQDAVQRWQALEDQLVNSATRGDALPADFAQRIQAAEQAIAGLDDELERRHPRYRELAQPRPMPLADARSLLKDGEAMLAYLLGPTDAFVWLVQPGGSRLVRLDTNQGELSEKIARLRARVDPLQNRDDYDPVLVGLAHELHQLLVAPVAAQLAGSRHVMLVLDGPMQSLPFNMLVTEASPGTHDYRKVPWLFKRYTTTVLPSVGSLGALRRFARASTADRPFAGIGNPVLQGAAGAAPMTVDRLFDSRAMALVENVRQLDPLPETALELRTIARAVDAGADNLYLGEVASEATVKSLELSRYRVLSFATHGLMSGDFAGLTEPALVLTPPDRPSRDDDGLLTASEIARLKLDADLVILSACNTAAADGTPGAEGFSGLTKAFFYSGSRSLMVSHWAVASEATVQLTTGMFAKGNRDAGPALALRRSMQGYLDRAPSSNLAHPMYWAPFVIVGEGS